MHYPLPKLNVVDLRHLLLTGLRGQNSSPNYGEVGVLASTGINFVESVFVNLGGRKRGLDHRWSWDEGIGIRAAVRGAVKDGCCTTRRQRSRGGNGGVIGIRVQDVERERVE